MKDKNKRGWKDRLRTWLLSLPWINGVPFEEHDRVLDEKFTPNLRRLLIENGRTDCTIENPLFKGFIEAVHSVYKGNGGPNFLVLECHFHRYPDGDDDPDQSYVWYDVIIQKSGMETCAAQLGRLNARIQELEAQVATYEKHKKPKQSPKPSTSESQA